MITAAHHHARLLFVFLVETGFLHVGQASLELPTSGDPPASASQSAGITGVSHHTQPPYLYLKRKKKSDIVILNVHSHLVLDRASPVVVTFTHTHTHARARAHTHASMS